MLILSELYVQGRAEGGQPSEGEAFISSVAALRRRVTRSKRVGPPLIKASNAPSKYRMFTGPAEN